MSKHILMLLTNPFRPDPRVEREAVGLVAAGYEVTVICWDRAAELPADELYKGVRLLRVQDVPSAYGSGWRQLFHLPRFWRKAVGLALQLRPDAIHCHDLDTLYAGWQIKKRLQIPLLYDAHEHYPALMSLYLPAPAIPLLAAWERFLIRRVDATITASTILADEFVAQGVRPVQALGNYPDIEPYLSLDKAERPRLRAELGVG